MNYIKIPRSELSVSQICFGGGQLGGFGWGTYDLKDTIKAAEKGIGKGINFFDTADCYGLGQSEINLGKLAKKRRDDLIISSKFGVKVSHNGKRVGVDNSKDYLMHSINQTLKRLETDYVDIYQIHYHDGITPVEEIFTNLEKLCKSGKIRYYGINNFSIAQLGIDLLKYPHLVNCSFEYSLSNREHESKIDDHIRIGLCQFSYGALGQGILSGKYSSVINFDDKDQRRLSKYKNFHGDKLKHNLKIVDYMKEICFEKYNSSCPQLAIAFIIKKYDKSAIITGIKNEVQLDDILGSYNLELDKVDFDVLDSMSTYNKIN